MATTKFVNRARMLTSTTGTGSSVTLTTAVDGYFTLDEAGLQDGDVVDYIIEQGADFEIQEEQTYNSSGPSLTRGTPAASKVGGTAGTSKVDLNGSAQVAIVAVAKSLDVSTFTVKTTPDDDDLLWAHSDADSARRAVPVSGILSRVPAAGLVLLNSGTMSDAATLDIDLSAFAGYRGVRFVLSGFVPAVDDRELWFRVSTDGGATFDASGYSWVVIWSRDAGNNAFKSGSGSDSKILLAGSSTAGESVSNASERGGVNAIVDLFDHANASRWPRVDIVKTSWFDVTRQDVFTLSGSGMRETAQDTDAVQFLFESGNIASGSWAVYGYT